MARPHGGSLRNREYGHQTHVKERGEGTSVAIFVTFKDKLGHTVAAASMFLVINDPLSCKIKVLEGLRKGNYWHPKCRYSE